MGFNTTVIIRNDDLHLMERDPKFFVTKLVNSILDFPLGSPPEGHIRKYVPGAYIVCQHHADERRLVLIGENKGIDVSKYDLVISEDDRKAALRILSETADKFGYRLSRKQKTRKKSKSR